MADKIVKYTMVIESDEESRIVNFYAQDGAYDPFVTPGRVWVPRNDAPATPSSELYWDIVPSHNVTHIEKRKTTFKELIRGQFEKVTVLVKSDSRYPKD